MGVSIGIWHQAWMVNSTEVKLSQKVMRGMGIKRDAVYRALAVLENAGLINVKRHVGRNSIVRILDVQRE